jgi:RNA polymerase sigma-70 factor (ECF subfamily)
MKTPPPSLAAASRRKTEAARTTGTASPERDARRQASKREADYDAQLVNRVRRGDHAAFAEIVGRYREKMFSVAFSLLRDRHDAEEIVQDTFVRAHRGIERFRGECSLATWLHRITVNLARNRYWYFHRRSRHSTLSLDCPISPESDGTFGDFFAAETAGPARETVTSEFVELITSCMDRLHPSHREILTLRNVLNQSYADIATALGIEEGTVKSRIARARGCLRTLMAETCPEFAESETPGDWLDLDFARGTPGRSNAG